MDLILRDSGCWDSAAGESCSAARRRGGEARQRAGGRVGADCGRVTAAGRGERGGEPRRGSWEGAPAGREGRAGRGAPAGPHSSPRCPGHNQQQMLQPPNHPLSESDATLICVFPRAFKLYGTRHFSLKCFLSRIKSLIKVRQLKIKWR